VTAPSAATSPPLPLPAAHSHPPAQLPLPTASSPARASLVVAPWQSVLRRGRIAAAVTCDRDCSVTAGGRIALGRGRFIELAAARRTLRAHIPGVVTPAVRSRHFRALRKALRRRGSLVATVTVTPAGGDPIERRARIR
jgi:hypothetical protein